MVTIIFLVTREPSDCVSAPVRAIMATGREEDRCCWELIIRDTAAGDATEASDDTGTEYVRYADIATSFKVTKLLSVHVERRGARMSRDIYRRQAVVLIMYCQL